MKVIIVGGGIIGLLTAKELLQNGALVTILERGEFGKEASWAGGGIVSPLYPWTYSNPITALASWSQSYYPKLVEELRSKTRIDPQLNPSGLLMLDPPDIEQALEWASFHGKGVSCLNVSNALELEPNVNFHTNQNLLFPYVGNVRNPRLLKSLISYLESHSNCDLIPYARVDGFEQRSEHVAVFGKEIHLAEKVILCSGAWTSDLLQMANIASSVTIEPVKGQMILFEPRPGLINSIVLRGGKYLIPRLDGHIVAGSTLEYQGFDKESTEQAKSLLLSSAYDMVPELKNAKVEAHWAGLRPGTAAGVPYIGKMPGWDNLYLNAGHFRNGLVLAPASARLMSNLILQQKPIIDPSPYDPARARILEPMH